MPNPTSRIPCRHRAGRLTWLPALAILLAPPALADEGMWTFDNFPAATVKRTYGFAPEQAWLGRVRLSAVRIAGGCSASLVSPAALVMTNHHCVHRCIEQLSDAQHDLVRAGFFAAQPRDEKRCPAMEINQLVEIRDVTSQVQQATAGVADARFFETQKAKLAELEQACAGGSDDVRCEVVSLYHGGRFDLYKYRRFQDVRLVFAPEFAVAFFGGDPDNFMFPRYDFDVGFLRIYGKDGKPLPTPEHFAWSKENAKTGDLAFVAGNPGATSRLFTVAQLEFERDVALPRAIARLSEQRGLLTEYQRRGAEQRRTVKALLFHTENALKACRGRHQALGVPAFFAAKAEEEQALREKVRAQPALAGRFGGAWEGIAAAVAKLRPQHRTFAALEHGFRPSELFGLARTLVRAADELTKPNGERLAELADARLPQLKQRLFAKVPIHDELEIALLSFCLTKLREDLGPDHPAVREVFGRESPEEIATRVVQGSRLQDAKVREQLFARGQSGIAASGDPLLRLAKALDPAARAARKRMEEEVEGPLKKHGELLAKAAFAIYGTGRYPDATGSPRLSYGAVKGWLEDGMPITPLTDFAGAYARATGRPPFALPASWLARKDRLDLHTPLDMATDNDIVGGNSGSPVVNRAAEVIGLIFDGNIHSLGGEYAFDPSTNRAVAVHGAAVMEALEKIYAARRIVDEIRGTASNPP
jgi:hypothetical protein